MTTHKQLAQKIDTLEQQFRQEQEALLERHDKIAALAQQLDDLRRELEQMTGVKWWEASRD